MQMGRRMGIIISIAAIGSRMHPIINKTNIIMKTDSVCPTDILTKKSTTFPGTRRIASVSPNKIEKAMIGPSMPITIAALVKEEIIS